MNNRLGTKGLNLKQIAGQAALKNLTIEDLVAMVEVDGIQYTGIEPRDGTNYVCSSYVAAAYQAAGLLHDINGAEFTPRDVYSLDVFDKNFVRPDVCLLAMGDVDVPYCQIMGKYRMKFPDYSTVTPYSRMAEHCPTVNPLYERLPGC